MTDHNGLVNLAGGGRRHLVVKAFERCDCGIEDRVELGVGAMAWLVFVSIAISYAHALHGHFHDLTSSIVFLCVMSSFSETFMSRLTLPASRVKTFAKNANTMAVQDTPRCACVLSPSGCTVQVNATQCVECLFSFPHYFLVVCRCNCCMVLSSVSQVPYARR